MIDKNNNGSGLHYRSPEVRVVRISTSAQILQSSLFGSTNSNPWNNGSESYYGFGDED